MPTRLIFGSMRLLQSSKTECEKLLTHALESGVTSFHSSIEYDSFDLFCDSIEQACKHTGVKMGDLLHTVKLAEPGFGDETFSEEKLLQAVNLYCDRLQTSQLDVVQWMLRGDLKDSPARVNALKRSDGQIDQAVGKLKQRGQINKFGCFPYSDDFRAAVLKCDWCDALVDYVNPLEQSAKQAADDLRDNQSLIAIRPLFPLTSDDPEIRQQWSVEQLMAYASSSNNLDGIIASTSSIEHLDTLIGLTTGSRHTPTQVNPS